MTIKAALTHTTSYTFAEPVKVYPHTVRLRPAPHSRTPIEAYSLDVEPKNHFINWQQDPFGNYLARLVFNEPVQELKFTVGLIADMTVINPFDFFVEDWARTYPFTYPDELRADLEPYLRPVDEAGPGSGPGDVVRDWIEDNNLLFDVASTREPVGIVDYLVEINSLVNRSVNYSVRMEVGVQTPDHTLTSQWGSCRDSAWLLVSVLRQLGLAARFVSGYLIQLTSDIAPVDGPSGPTADFTDLHAWAEVFIPGAGWVGLDATSGLFAGEGHIPLACTPHPSSAAPIEGATAPVEVTFGFSNEVHRIFEDPRVTLPYSETQWQQVDALGAHVDTLLADGDVRLTMGGEPTFVSVDNNASPQWNGAADGEQKRELASQLADRLKARLAPNGLLHHGQGKWYPGEPLPRWQIKMSWRHDGEPIWRDESLQGRPWSQPDMVPGSEDAAGKVRSVALAIASRIGVPANCCQPAWNDPFDVLWNEARQPAGEPPTDDLTPDDTADAASRRDAVKERDLSATRPQAWVVPMFEVDGGWGTAKWRVRRERLFLTGGTSAAGYRLPLSSIAWTPQPDFVERDALAELGDLPTDLPKPFGTAATLQDIEVSPRTALCVEERDGHLYVFLPPLTRLESALELVSAIEAAAAWAQVPVILEGYSLPGDPRVESLSVTPDPGVIEVNVQPTSTWEALRDTTEALYEDARQTHLTTEKFDLDGTHTGTGGGNHFTIGGASVKDSPLLRRPDLLRSLVTYWQHHPALSYVFSGRFIGPTSQAPRVDEGRFERLYEMEIAFAELDRVLAEDADSDADADDVFAKRAWAVDGLLRNLLTDLTGNTHRSEFCIDKLFSRDSERGKLGLLEMRGFEMPPHARMSLVQALLVRCLIAKFWAEPYEADLIRWGTRLHDRFLLGAWAAADLQEVVDDVNRFLARTGDAAPQFDAAWFAPFFEFRFPRLGEATLGGVHVELRQAIEPWHVLGEEATSTGTARYVDSSVERVQVSATGLIPERHLLTCNGVPIPLAPIGTGDAVVGGVRYRAWAPASALHPTMGVHSPLRFEVVDRQAGLSLGGFTYHVVHPGGRGYEAFPVNAVEAESRRSNRFHVMGHTPGRLPVPSDAVLTRHAAGPGTATEYAYTTDLRRFTAGRPPGPETEDDAGDE